MMRILTTGMLALGLLAGAAGIDAARADNWYTKSFFLLHEDHHTSGQFEVGRDCDPDQTARLVALADPDVIQIHAKGNPGWTTYPSKIGHTPPKLARDVLAVWRDVARQQGRAFSVYYNIGRDGEIMTRRPEWNRVGPDGTPRERALCYHSGVAEAYLWPMLREIIEGYHPDGFWFDGSCFTVRTCYCDKCRERFQREQHLELPKSPDEPGWDAFQEMQRQIYREFVHETAAMIHRLDPKCLVAVNWAYSLRMPERPGPGIAYLTGDIGNHVEGLSAEAHWYDSQGLPFDLMTQVNTLPGAPWLDGVEKAVRMGPKPPVQIEQEMAIIIANGGRYFAWDTPTPTSGLDPARFRYMADVVAPFLRARQPWCLGYQRVPDVSLLHSAAAHYAVNDESTTSFSKSDNRIDGATDALPRLHLNYEMVPDWRLAEGDVKSPLLIVEHPKVLTAVTVDGLVRFVREGGHLLMTGMGITRDKRLGELFGIGEYTPAKGAEPLAVKLSAGTARFDHWLFRLKPSTASCLMEVEDAAGGVHPMLTRNRFGQGAAYYVPIPLLSKHGKNVVPDELLKTVFGAVLPSAERLVTTDAPPTVEVVLRRKGPEYVLHLVNMAPGERETVKGGKRQYRTIPQIPPVAPCHVSLRLPQKPAAVQLQPQNAPVDQWRYEDGRLEVEVPQFEIHQMLAIKLGK